METFLKKICDHNIYKDLLSKNRSYTIDNESWIKRNKFVYLYKCGSILRLIIATTVIGLIGLYSSARAESLNEMDILSTVIEAMKNSKPDYGSGCGTALLQKEKHGEQEKRIIEFKYKGRSTRSDVYYEDKGKRSGLEVKYAVNQQNAVTYRHKNEDAWVFGDPQSIFYHQFGYDLHAETFEKYYGRSIHFMLSSMLRLQERKSFPIEVDLDEQGILLVRQIWTGNMSGSNTKKKADITIRIDTNDGFRLLSVKELEENLEGVGSKTEMNFKVDWKKYGSKWYIKSAEYRKNEIVVRDRNDEPIEPKKEKECTRIEVLNYEPDPEIKDIEFTLKGLDLPIGTKVSDKIVGIIYMFGGPTILEDSLLEPLDKADDIKKRINEMLSENNEIKLRISNKMNLVDSNILERNLK